MHRSALLVVDVQNDFCPGGALAVNNGDLVIEPLNKMIVFADKDNWLLFFSRDRHPHTTKHFKEFGGIWPMHCVRTTWGARFHPNLIVPTHSSSYIVSKGESTEDDGYSPFEGHYYYPYDNHERTTAYEQIPFNTVLTNLKVTDLYVGGLATDYCVKAACLDARRLGYTVYLLTDACKAVNLKPMDERDALIDMKHAGVIFTTTDEVLAQS